MKRSGIIRVAVTTLLVSIWLSNSALAFLGFGDIVFDPSVHAEIVEQLRQMERQSSQLVRTYQTVRNQYDLLVRMAQRVPVNMAARYRAVATPWRMAAATNTYGTTGRWVSGLNTGVGVHPGYADATQALDTYGAALSQIPGNQLQRLKTQYATVELTDGANITAMQTIGAIRANAEAVERAIRSLEEDSLSSNPAMNTQVAVLNKMNAAHVIALRTAQDSNKVLVALAEQQVTAAKRTRDTEAQAIHNHIRFRTQGRAVMTAQAAGASDAMRAWRMR